LRIQFQNPSDNGKKNILAANSLNLLTFIELGMERIIGFLENKFTLLSLDDDGSFNVLMVLILKPLICFDNNSTAEFSLLFLRTNPNILLMLL
jgi:hypothetical protein